MSDKGDDRDGAVEGREVVTLGGGCFWCMEAIFDDVKGVDRVESGYSGGRLANPSYEQVCTGKTGHAEVVQIVFDPNVVTLKTLLEFFFTVHDPTTLNRQGSDVGSQYRSVIFYRTDRQKSEAEEVVRSIEAAGIWEDPIVTELAPFTEFFKAEGYHAQYFKRNGGQPYCRLVIAPKVAKFREHYREKLKRGQ
jgi:peptide-methionine (S)-S-oxide reductase